MNDRDDADFRDYVGDRLVKFRREAFLRCLDWDEAEDLVQHALEKLYVRWNWVRRTAEDEKDRDRLLDGYVRKTIKNKFLDERNSAFWRHTDRESAVPEDDPDDQPVHTFPHDDHEELVRALKRLPEDQREVMVLRYWEDMSVDGTANTLGIPAWKVKRLAGLGRAALARDLSKGDRGGVRD